MGKRNKNKDKDPYTGPTHSGRKDSESDDDYRSNYSESEASSFADDSERLDNLYDKAEQLLEICQEAKSTSSRVMAIHSLVSQLSTNFMPEYIDKNKMTLLSLANKLSNKQNDEGRALANLIATVSIQAGEEIDELIKDPMAEMRVVLMDSSKGLQFRAACAVSLAITTRLSCTSDECIAENIKACRFAWANTKVVPESARLVAMSISSWCLLLLDGDYHSVTSAISDQPKLVVFLSSAELDVRMAAGEAFAFLHEFLQDSRPGFKFPNHAYVLETMGNMIDDSSKKKTKKERRLQRFTIREVYSYLADEDDPPQNSVKFGHETLNLDTCAIKLFYDMCCDVMSGGIDRQLATNEIIREVFGLGAVPVARVKGNKAEKQAYHEAVDKCRNQVRGKQRDKRAVL